VIVTLNDHPAMRVRFKEFQTERVNIRYTVGGASDMVSRGELIIYSCTRVKDSKGLFRKSERTHCPNGSRRIVADGAMMQRCDGPVTRSRGIWRLAVLFIQ
jgi:hypothetical protein